MALFNNKTWQQSLTSTSTNYIVDPNLHQGQITGWGGSNQWGNGQWVNNYGTYQVGTDCDYDTFRKLLNIPNDISTLPGIQELVRKLLDGEVAKDVDDLNERIVMISGVISIFELYLQADGVGLPENEIKAIIKSLSTIVEQYQKSFERLAKLTTLNLDKLKAVELGLKIAEEKE